MNVTPYLRVSGLGQVDKDGEQRQLDAVLAFCTANNLHALKPRFEAGVSGTVEGVDRPQLAEIFDSGCKAIVVERLDRLARDLMVQELILKECRERGIKVFAADQPFDDLASNSGDPTRKLFRQIIGALAEWEKSALVMKLRKARDRKRALTGRCEGILPWGQTPQGKRVLNYILTLRTLEIPVPRIASKLNQRGVTTRWGKPWTKRAVLHYLCNNKTL